MAEVGPILEAQPDKIPMLKAIRGTKDILPGDTGIWQYLEQSARDIFGRYGYREIRTPVFEDAALFIRSIGKETDIIQKEMYVFSDRGGRMIALRPEATACIVRAFLENSLGTEKDVTKLYYIGPMFRSERPQKGRQRQFHQLGVECIGSDNPFLDAEIISLSVKFLQKIGVKNFILKINSLGCQDDKRIVMEKNRHNIKPHLALLCDECKMRYNKNALRIFDCKEAKCRDAVRHIKFELESLLCEECTNHFNSVKEALDALGIPYLVDSKIVRGLDYYTRTVFEIIQSDLGAKDAICAGGRYNNLIQELGGKYSPAIGFAFGIERLILALNGKIPGTSSSLDVFIAIAGKGLYRDAFKLTDSLRQKGISCDIDYEERSLKAQMKKAERLQARFVIIFGEEEFARNRVVVRDMRNREQKEVDVIKVGDELNPVYGQRAR